jgi:hypothetical protein
LLREEEGIQHPIYYSNQTLYDTKTRYLKVKEIALVLMSASSVVRLASKVDPQ